MNMTMAMDMYVDRYIAFLFELLMYKILEILFKRQKSHIANLGLLLFITEDYILPWG